MIAGNIQGLRIADNSISSSRDTGDIFQSIRLLYRVELHTSINLDAIYFYFNFYFVFNA
jgi:hypothetical protein